MVVCILQNYNGTAVVAFTFVWAFWERREESDDVPTLVNAMCEQVAQAQSVKGKANVGEL